MDETTRSAVRARANGRCEYCLLREDDDVYTFHIEHIIAKKHRGETVLENLALACHQCNLHKGTDLTGRDPVDDKVTELFNPREQNWPEHFRFVGARIEGLTNAGRTTVYVLDINEDDRLELRELLRLRDANG
jgi:hypothetical protein